MNQFSFHTAIRAVAVSASFALTFAGSCSEAQVSGSSVYFGIGTSVSSYIGGYFGNAYALRVISPDSYYYDDYYYNYGYYDYDYYELWSPLQVDLTGGVMVSDNIAIETEASFVFHYNGRLDPEFESGSNNGRAYLDRNDYAQLYAVPISLTAKLMLRGGGGFDAYIKAGPAVQYTEESHERIREYYSYEGYNEYSYDTYLRTVSKERWLSGFRIGIGTQYVLDAFLGGYTELEYSYFDIDGDNSTALALDKAPEAQLFSLKTMLFFSF